MRLDLGFTESEEMLKRTALDFMRRDAPKDVVQSLQETDTGHSPETWRTITGMGWPGILIPEEYGGTGSNLTGAAALFEGLGTGPLPGPYFSSSILGVSAVLEAATDGQKRQILPSVADGTDILALALTEPDYSWDPGAVQTKAARSGDGYVIDGVKLFAYDAAAAGKLLVAARIGDGVGLLLVDAAAEGVSVSRIPGFLEGRSFSVKLDSVRVPESALLGATGDSTEALERAIARSIPVLCAYKVGGCDALVEMALEYSRLRVQFGQAIGRFQRVQDLIIEMVNHRDAARWTTYECLWKLDTGRQAAESVHLAKAVASEAYWETCTLAHRVFSGVSYSKEHPASFHTRASRSLYHYLGDPAHHRQRLGHLIVGI
jgi:alkylation response protein AidB-like acyl-CoA dehydrogenase